MKKIIVQLVTMCFIVAMGAGMTLAADKILNSTVRDVVQAVDKRGNEYIRVIVSDERELNGVKYETDAAMMAFGPQVAEAKTIKKGDKIKAIVSSREYQGRTSYTLLKLLK